MLDRRTEREGIDYVKCDVEQMEFVKNHFSTVINKLFLLVQLKRVTVRINSQLFI